MEHAIDLPLNTHGVFNSSTVSFSGTLNTNHTEMDPDCTPPEIPLPVHEQIFIIIMYGLVSVTAVAGNAIVCYIVIAFEKMRRTENIFIFNLAVTDIVLALLCVPFTFVPNLILGTYPFGLAMCKVMNYSQIVSVLVSSYTLVAISIERYMGIVYPFRLKLTRRKVTAMVILIWVTSLAVALPTLIHSQIVQQINLKGTEILQCVEKWPGSGGKEESSYQSYIYGMILMATQYFLPVGIMIFTYSTIAVHVWGTKTPGEALKDRDKKIKDEKTRMTKMMVVVVLLYIISWLPLNVYNVIADNQVYQEFMYCFKYLPYIWFSCHWLAMSHATYNPIIYFWMNSKVVSNPELHQSPPGQFRAGFIYALNFIFCFRRLPDQWLIDNKLISGYQYTSVKNSSQNITKLDFSASRICTSSASHSLDKNGNSYSIIKANGKTATNGKVINGSLKAHRLPVPNCHTEFSCDSRTALKDNDMLDLAEVKILLPEYPVSAV